MINIKHLFILSLAICHLSMAVGLNSVSPLRSTQAYDVMTGLLGINTGYVNGVPAVNNWQNYYKFFGLLSDDGDPKKIAYAQATAYFEVAYGLCAIAIKAERLIPVSNRLFLNAVTNVNAAPSTLLPMIRKDILQRMSVRFTGIPLTSAEETSFLSLLQATESHADSYMSGNIPEALPNFLSGSCAILLGSAKSVGI